MNTYKPLTIEKESSQVATLILSDDLKSNDCLNYILQAQAVMKAVCSTAESKADEYLGLDVLINAVYRDLYECCESDDDEKHAKSSLSLGGACSLFDAYIACDAGNEALNAVQTLLSLAKLKAAQEWEALRVKQTEPA